MNQPIKYTDFYSAEERLENEYESLQQIDAHLLKACELIASHAFAFDKDEELQSLLQSSLWHQLEDPLMQERRRVVPLYWDMLKAQNKDK